MSYDDRFSPSKRFTVPQPTMRRLADYFLVVGFSEKVSHYGARGSGFLIQRFPIKDWEDEPFINDMEVFWQPLGWELSSEKGEPKFFMCVLTDPYGTRRYCACLSFHEPYSLTNPLKPVDEDGELEVSGKGDSLGNAFRSFVNLTEVYAPKVLCIASRLNLAETFRHCLGTIYTAFVENSSHLETLIGNLLGHVHVPAPGGPQFRFSIGGGDRQIIQPPSSQNIPVTNTSVALLFQQLGINNVLTLFCAVMTEQKILMFSRSSSRLYDSCSALAALMYPFKWLHTFIPLLPATLVEVAQSPTPFLIGILSQALDCITEKLMDVIQVDLDGGSVILPELVRDRNDSCFIPKFPDSLWTQVFDDLTHLIHPELPWADLAFPPLASKPSNTFELDKEIRAVFLRLLAQLFQGYRSCLVIIRIHPTPVITFHQAKFLGERGLSENVFVRSLLNSQCFNQFLAERGSPYRPTDIWDELYASLPLLKKCEGENRKQIMKHIKLTGEQLAHNEFPNSTPCVPNVPKGPETDSNYFFPFLNQDTIQDIINDGLSKQALSRYNSITKLLHPKIVPFGPKTAEKLDEHKQSFDNSVRRLEVLRNCIASIFENRLSDARKSIHAVTRTLKSKSAKLVLCEELSRHVTANKAVLEQQQFDLVVKLMHCALQENSETDEYGIAAAILPLATSFCRKLCTGVIQFAYTCLQDHPVWKNQQFWESAFYSDVQKDIKALYSDRFDPPATLYNNNYSTISGSERKDVEIGGSRSVGEWTALDIAAEQLRLAQSQDSDKIRELVSTEESTLYSQAIHYANRMVYMLIPMDTPPHPPPLLKNHLNSSSSTSHHHHHSSHTHHNIDAVSNITSVAESDSVGEESGVGEAESNLELGSLVTKTVTRFVDKVCSEGGVTEDHIRSLHSMIPGVVEMHKETLESVSRESKRLPGVPKAKISTPILLPGEEMMIGSLRGFLIGDGREIGESVGGGGDESGSNVNKCPLPAQGALFSTNYRLIFKGTPTDQSLSVQVVVRSVPMSTITKEKRFTVPYIAHIDQKLQEGLQIRSSTCQLLKVAFDEEVTSEQIDSFRKMINKLRAPSDIYQYFAFSGQSALAIPAYYATNKDKNTTLKVFAKKTLMMTAKKVGVKPKNNSKKQKYVLRSWTQGNGGTLPASTRYLSTQSSSSSHSPIGSPRSDPVDGDEISLGSTGSLSEVSDDEYAHYPLPLSAPPQDVKAVERLSERCYGRDWRRLGLGPSPRSVSSSPALSLISRAESFRLSHLNTNYSLCPTYPALLLLPSSVSDESMRKLGRVYSGGRVPVITWRHPLSRALLLRSSALSTKGIASRVFGGQKNTVSGHGEMSGSSLEVENFLRAISQATPLPQRPESIFGEISTSSGGVGGTRDGRDLPHHNFSTPTPESNRRGGSSSNPFTKAMDTLRYAATTGSSSGKSWSRRPSSLLHPLPPPPLPNTHQSGGGEGEGRRVSVYVFLDKSKSKGMRSDGGGSRVEYVSAPTYGDGSRVRNSFKLLLRATAPSLLPSHPNESFYQAFQDSEWLLHLSHLLSFSGAIVDLLDLQGSSVILSLGDEADISSQVSSLAQLCMDPYYRTIEGFHTLIEKEWLAFGHKFSERNNMCGLDGIKSTHAFTPIFLQFLDAVHQIHSQFPMHFEFNEYYLMYLGYHSMSGRFRTFLLDSEYERVLSGFVALDDLRGSLPRHYKGFDPSTDEDNIYFPKLAGSNSHQTNLGQSIFDYIEKIAANVPLFFNKLYRKDTEIHVLRPVSSIANLKIWKFYLQESLSVGSLYDLEIFASEVYKESLRDSAALDSLAKDSRRVVSAEYDIVEHHIPDYLSYLFREFHKCEELSGILPQKWREVAECVESGVESSGEKSITPLLSKSRPLLRPPRPETEEVREVALSLHRNKTRDILSRGGRAEPPLPPHSQSHRYEKHTFSTLAPCDNCSSILIIGKNGLRCVDCGIKCHEKCAFGNSKCTGGYRNGVEVRIETNNGVQSSAHDVKSTPSVSSHGSSNEFYRRFQSTDMAENRTHEGYLYKRGALLKGWRLRWFVLDSIKHQLRYYETLEDSHSKGFIDLSEVKKVVLAHPTPGAPKKSDDKSFFDIFTTKRCHNFCANDANAAQDWIEKISACL